MDLLELEKMADPEITQTLLNLESRLREQELARAESTGRQDERWKNQGIANEWMQRKLSALDKRMSAAEKRIYWIAGAAAAAGGSLPAVISSMFGG